jgi:hypothetical protein
MHEYGPITFHRDNTPLRLRNRQSERQRKGKPHCVLDIKIFWSMIDGGP